MWGKLCHRLWRRPSTHRRHQRCSKQLFVNITIVTIIIIIITIIYVVFIFNVIITKHPVQTKGRSKICLSSIILVWSGLFSIVRDWLNFESLSVTFRPLCSGSCGRVLGQGGRQGGGGESPNWNGLLSGLGQLSHSIKGIIIEKKEKVKKADFVDYDLWWKR